jgi:hypothetical protein
VQGRSALAAPLVGVADVLWDDLTPPMTTATTQRGRIDLARMALGEEVWTIEYRRGRALSLAGAVQLALQYTEEP